MVHFCGNMAMKAAHPLMKKEPDVVSICLEGQPETFSSLCTVFFLFPAPRKHDIDCLSFYVSGYNWPDMEFAVDAIKDARLFFNKD